ncbi:MAG: T9SS type A sorting domain-containing protein [Candidatus Cloacimonas acidaminovorans]|nr:T9SS type A sorting domain-containing protein [Candidatus Cloacimonas acidaminovorans]
MKRSHYLFIAISLMAMTALLGAQQTPQIVDVDQLPFSVSMVSDVVVMGNFCYIQTLQPSYIAKIDLLTKEVVWQQLYSDSGSFGHSLVKTPDGNLCHSVGSEIVKITLNGDICWTRDLSSYGGVISVDNTNDDFLTCYSNYSNLIILDYEDGTVIGQWAIPAGGNHFSHHFAIASPDSVFYCFDNTPYGTTSNTAIKLTKVQINTVAEVIWSFEVPDLEGAVGSVDNDIIYFGGKQIQLDTWLNTLLYKIEDMGDNYQLVSTTDIAGPDTTAHVRHLLLNNHELLLSCLIVLGDDPNGQDGSALSMFCYNQNMNLVWQISQNILPFFVTQAVALSEDAAKLYAISIYRQTYSGPDTTWLTEISLPTPVTDPVLTPNINDVCYPNPFRNSTTIKFEMNSPASTSIAVYNIKGQVVRHLVQS